MGCPEVLCSSDMKFCWVEQVRVVVERLARRLGYDPVAANIPEEHRKLLTHIRKEKTRKLRDDKAEKVHFFLFPTVSPSLLCIPICKSSIQHVCIYMLYSSVARPVYASIPRQSSSVLKYTALCLLACNGQ